MSAASPWAWLCLALTIGLTVTGQTLQKRLAMQTPSLSGAAAWREYLRRPLFWGAGAALGVALLCWLRVLTELPVGKAYPLLGANYVAMLVVARVGFSERVSPRRWAGVALIIAGLALVSGS